ncbi:MAG: CHASE2 domain-containing protein [Candidatus Omnitrophica bacterium]|nr:CHASE2 domain-containing protein [Candidatus Omnitrophota bacterium]
MSRLFKKIKKERKDGGNKRRIIFKRSWFAVFIAFAIVSIYVYLIVFVPAVKRAGLRFEDYLFSLRHKYYERVDEENLIPEDIVLVTIDEESYARLKRRWPWNRGVFADFIDKIRKYGPKTIALDIALHSPTVKDPQADAKLAEAIRGSGNVVLASVRGREKVSPEPYDIFKFVKASAGYGIIGYLRDQDNVIRRFKPFTLVLSPQEEGDISFEMKALAHYLDISYDEIYRAGRRIIIDSEGGKITIPTDKEGNILINYISDAKFINTVPIWRVMDGSLPKDIFIDKLVVVTQAGETFQDSYPTPLGYRSSGLIVANVLNSIIKSSHIRRESALITIPVILLVYILSFVFFSRAAPLKGFFMLIAIGGIYLTASFMLFLRGVIWPTFHIMVLLPVLFLGLTFHKYGYVVYERAEIKRLAITDSLTNLYTHRYFRFLLDHIVKKSLAFGSKCSLIVIKLINLDSIVKELSFHKGQMVQRDIAALIRVKLPSDTSGAYLGMGELCMLLPKIGLYEALGIAGSLRKRISQESFDIKDSMLKPIVAVGVSELNSGGFPKTGIELMRAARTAMARSREFGHNKVCRFNPKIDSSVFEPDIMEREIRQRLDDEFSFLVIDLEERNKELENLLHQLSVTQRDLEHAHFETLRSLIVALEEKDPCTAGHSERVGAYAERIGRKLKIPEEELRLLRQAAVLHDIGKVGISQGILRKEGTLSRSERTIIELHPEFSVRILNTSKYFSRMLHAIRDHHERLDGSGYPRGLKRDQISIEAQIIAVCDAYDAMTADRPYRKALSPAKAMEELSVHQEKYNNRVVLALKQILKDDSKLS